ncbi:MAG: polysaccharide biosynthesis protein [Clostridiales bacterium]|nr:polysaccharide biosynthesis protein [Clostridiales bacterium]
MKKQSTAKNFAILGMANILVKVLAIIYIPFQTRILGNIGNGIVADGMNVYLFLYSLSNAGLPNAISKLVSEQTATGNYRAAQKILKCAYMVLLTLGVVVALFLALGANFIAVKLLDDPDASLMLLTIAPTLIFTSVSCALRGYFQGRQNMMPVAISNVLEQLLNCVFTVLFAWLLVKYGLRYGAAGTTIGTLVGGIGAAAFLCFFFFNITGKQRKKEIEQTSEDAPRIMTRQVYKKIVQYSIPAILNTIAVCAGSLIDSYNCKSRLVVSHAYTYQQALSLFGIYSFQFQRLFTLAIAFSTALVTAMIPSISEALALNNSSMLKNRINKSYKAIYLITIPSIFGISFLATPLITLIFPSAIAGSDLVIFGTWTAILMTIQYVQSAVLIGAGNPAAPSIHLIIGMVVKTILNYVLISIPAINIKGAIIGNAAGWIVAVVLNQISIKKRFTFHIRYIRMMLRPAFASILMGFSCMLFYKATDWSLLKVLSSPIIANDIAVFLAAVFGAGIYFGIMIIIRGVTKNELIQLPFGSKVYRFASKIPIFRTILNEG